MPKQWISLFLAGVMFLTLAGCSSRSQQTTSTSRYGGASNEYAPPPPQREKPGLSTKQKLVLLAGAAALAYMYNKNKNNQGTGPQGKYYRSKNGRVYYRDAQGKAHWVSPPSQGIYVPQQEAEIYRNRAREFSYPGSNAVPGPSGY